MYANNEVSVIELEPRKAPEPMPYIEPPCKPKVPEVSLLINNAAPTGNVRQLNHPAAPEDSYNAWKWRQSNMIETKNNNRPIQHSLKQLDPPLSNSTRACYSDTKHADERYGTVTENWHFSPGTQLYTPIGESTPLQGILRNSGRNAVMYDKTSHRVSYQPGKPLTEGSYPDVNTCLNSSNQMSHRSYGSSNHMHANQENVMFHRVPVSRNHSNQLQIPEYNCYTDQQQWELKEKQHPAPGGMHPPGSCCGSHVPSGDMYNGCSNDEDPKCNRVSANLTKPQSCCSNASRNCCISNVEVHNDNKKTPKGGRVKETLEPQPQLLPALFRLVCMQNEQLQQLKEQVQKLVQKLETSAQPAKVCMQNVAVQSENVCSCYQQKVSVGVMVAVAEEQEVHVKANRFEQQQQLVPVATSSCQSCQKSTPAVDETINFSSMQLPTVHEPAPSPMTTMHVDMHDYQSDDEHGDVGARPSPWHGNDGRHKDQHQQAEDGDRIHWTFYSNVMQQMNKLMVDGADKNPVNNTAEDTQKKIQMATFKELVHMGVSICDAASAVGDQSLLFDPRLNMMAANTEAADSEHKPKMNPEALKYLDEQLRQTDKNDAGNKLDLTLFLKTSNLSFTAMRYLQQNHGLPLYTEKAGKGAQLQRSPAVHNSSPRHHQCCYSHDAPPSKVLDITMLKQQPKLL